MRLKDLTSGIKNALKKPVDEALVRDDEYVDLADNISWGDLNPVMQQWVREADRELDDKDHQVLKALLADRWQMTQRTDADYFMNPYSEVTLIFRSVAELLAEALGGGTNWLSLLIPSLKPEVAARYSNSDFKFEEFVINSDLDNLVRINQVFKANGLAPDLTPSMIHRVVKHDVRTEKMNTAYELPSRNATRKALANIKKGSDVPLPVNSSYGEAGLNRLKHECYKRLSRYCATFNNLIELMAGQFPRKEWSECVAGFGVDQMAKLMLNGLTMSAFVSTLNIIKDDKYHQAMAYVILSHYRSNRAEGNDLYLLGAIRKYIMRVNVPDKKTKVDLVDYLLKQLSGEKDYSLTDIAASLAVVLTPDQLIAASDGVLSSILKPFFSKPLPPAVKEENDATIEPMRLAI